MNENNLKKLHVERVFLRGDSRNTLCCAFYCINDNKEVIIIAPQTMLCIFCHDNPILNVIQKLKLGKD
jgi:hypothetical protein